jgi:probable F420-dependent oxidoreductase
MQVGIVTGVTDESIGPVALAQAVEERGFESLFVGGHSHIPVRRETPKPDNPGGDLPRDFARTFDPFVTLAMAAAVTKRLRLGTGIALVVQRDPINLAKEVATLDLASGGRFELGIGAGWLREEMRNHGTEPTTRVALLRERVLAMKAIWTQEEAEFHGSFVDFDPLHSWPKPRQRPHPPVLIGGWGPTTHERILDYGDGWMAPVAIPATDLGRGIDELRRLAAERGRGEVPVTATLIGPEPRDLAALADIGVARALLAVAPAAPEADTRRTLDALARVTEAWGSASPIGSTPSLESEPGASGAVGSRGRGRPVR